MNDPSKMCEQTVVEYKDGDVVWVKLGPCWWPGEVHDVSRVPPEIQPGLKKSPIAYVHFFQEKKYEYVKTMDHIHHYNCRRKKEFIKKGLDMHRAKQKHMDKFPMDVCTAERLTDGDPDIITSDEFAPARRFNYNQLFGTPPNKRTPKRNSLGTPRGRGRKANTSPRTPTLRQPLNICLDYDVHFLGAKDEPELLDTPECSTAMLQCHLCNFQCSRINVLILHRKGHANGNGYSVPSVAKKRGPKPKSLYNMTPCATSSIDEDLELLRRGVDLATYDNGSKRKPKMNRPTKKQLAATSSGDSYDSKTSNVKLLRDNLLADWDDSDGEKEKDEDELDTANTSRDFNTSGNNDQFSQVLDAKQILQEKSCFDFEEEEEATIISKSPGRKIPRVIPESQKPKSPIPTPTAEAHPAADRLVVEEPVTAEPDSQNEPTIKPKRRGRKPKIKTDNVKIDEVPAATPDKVTSEHDFNVLMEETALPVIPSLPDVVPAALVDNDQNNKSATVITKDVVSTDDSRESDVKTDEDIRKSEPDSKENKQDINKESKRKVILKRNRFDTSPIVKPDVAKHKLDKQVDKHKTEKDKEEKHKEEILKTDPPKKEKEKPSVDKEDKEKEPKQKETKQSDEKQKELKQVDKQKISPKEQLTYLPKDGKKKSIKDSSISVVKDTKRKTIAKDVVVEIQKESTPKSAFALAKDKRKSVQKESTPESSKEVVRKSLMRDRNTPEISKDKRKFVTLKDKSPEVLRMSSRKLVEKELSIEVVTGETKPEDTPKVNRRKAIVKENTPEVVPPKPEPIPPKPNKRKPLSKELKFEQALQESDTVYLPKSMKFEEVGKGKRRIVQKEKAADTSKEIKRKTIPKEIVPEIVVPEKIAEDIVRSSKRKSMIREVSQDPTPKVSKIEESPREKKRKSITKEIRSPLPTTNDLAKVEKEKDVVKIVSEIVPIETDTQIALPESVPDPVRSESSSEQKNDIDISQFTVEEIELPKEIKKEKEMDTVVELTAMALHEEDIAEKIDDKVNEILKEGEKITEVHTATTLKTIESLDDLLAKEDDKEDESVKVMISLNDFKMEDIPLPPTGQYVPKRKDVSEENVVDATPQTIVTEPVNKRPIETIKEKTRTPIKFEISKMKAQLNKKLKHTHRSFLATDDDESSLIRKGHASRPDSFKTTNAFDPPIKRILKSKVFEESDPEESDATDKMLLPLEHANPTKLQSDLIDAKSTSELSMEVIEKSNAAQLPTEMSAEISELRPEQTEQINEAIEPAPEPSEKQREINVESEIDLLNTLSARVEASAHPVATMEEQGVCEYNRDQESIQEALSPQKKSESDFFEQMESAKQEIMDTLGKDTDDSMIITEEVHDILPDDKYMHNDRDVAGDEGKSPRHDQFTNFSHEEFTNKSHHLEKEEHMDVQLDQDHCDDDKPIETISSFDPNDLLNNGVSDMHRDHEKHSSGDNILSILEEKTETPAETPADNNLLHTEHTSEFDKAITTRNVTNYVDEFESIENEIQKITSAQTSPCKLNAFPENIAVITTPSKDSLSNPGMSLITKDLYPTHLSSDLEPTSIMSTDVKTSSDNSIESEIAKLTDTKPEEGEIIPTQNYSTTSSKLLEILESKTEKAKIEKKFVPVTIADTKQKFIGLTAAQKKTVAMSGKMIAPKTGTKFVIKSATIKDGVQKKSSKPIILSEEIIKPADDTAGNMSGQTVSKRTYEDDIATFIIEKPSKKMAIETTSGQQSVAMPKTSRTKPTVLSQTIITSTGRIIDGSIESKETGDDNMFDINSMPIVLSDDLLPPESYEGLPMVLSNVSDGDKQTKTLQMLSKAGKMQSEKTKVVGKRMIQSVMHPGLSKNQKVYQAGSTKMMTNKPAVITQPGKPGKFIIVPTSSAPATSGSKYTVGKRTVRPAPQSTVVVKPPVTTIAPSSTVFEQKLKSNAAVAAAAAAAGNKIMVVTDSRGQQSRIVLSPAHQKMLGTKVGTKLVSRSSLSTKGTTLSLNNIVTSKGDILTPTSTLVQSKLSQSPQTLVTSKGQILTSVHSQSIITSKGQILTPVTPTQMKALKTGMPVSSGKKIQLHSQKIILPANSQKTPSPSISGLKTKTLLVKGTQRTLVQKIQMNTGTPQARQVNPIVQKQTPIKPILPSHFGPQTSKQKLTLAPKTPNVIKRQVIRGPASMGQPQQRVILQKVAPSELKPTGLQRAQHKIDAGSAQKTYIKHGRHSPAVSASPSVPPLVPLSPSQAKSNDALMAQPSTSLSAMQSAEPQPQGPKQLIIQDDMGNQTSITQGQILAVPGGEVVDGQPQSYMLVTVDEAGNLLPLDNQALMALDPNLIGPDGNVMLQFNQSLTGTDSPQSGLQSSAADQHTQMESLEIAKTQAMESVQTSQEYQQLLITDDQQNLIALAGAEQQLLMADSQNLLLTNQSVLQDVKTSLSAENRVTYSIANAEDGQQILISGDPEKAQHLINALTSGTQDLSQIISGTEGNLIINADGQQIILNTDSGGNEQIILTSSADSFNLQENYNTDFVTQATTNQDILAAALANTDVFQQDSAISEGLNIVTSATGGPLMATTSELSPSLYQSIHLPNLASTAVLETSLTNMAPIMSPLEVPTSGTAKKIPLDMETTSQVPKSLELPITITDPNISQTVSSQQLANELQNTLGLPITVTDPNISNVRVSELSTSSYGGFSLPSIESAVEAVTTASSGPISMPLLTEDLDAEPPRVESPTVKETTTVASNSPKVLPEPLRDIFEESGATGTDSHGEGSGGVDGDLGANVDANTPVQELEKAGGSALEVLANVTTASGMIDVSEHNPELDHIFAAEKKEDQLPADVFAQSTYLNQMDSKSDDSESGNVHEAFARSSRLGDHFVLESPHSEIDANSDEISIQPSIVSDEGSHPLPDSNTHKRNFADCNLDDTSSDSKKIKFDSTTS